MTTTHHTQHYSSTRVVLNTHPSFFFSSYEQRMSWCYVLTTPSRDCCCPFDCVTRGVLKRFNFGGKCATLGITCISLSYTLYPTHRPMHVTLGVLVYSYMRGHKPKTSPHHQQHKWGFKNLSTVHVHKHTHVCIERGSLKETFRVLLLLGPSLSLNCSPGVARTKRTKCIRELHPCFANVRDSGFLSES